MRIAFLLYLMLLFAGCSEVQQPPPPISTDDPGKQLCVLTRDALPSGTRLYTIEGCPVLLGRMDLNLDAAARYTIPANTTGLGLVLSMDTLATGVLQLSLTGGNHRWNISFVGSYPNDRERPPSPGGLTPRAYEYHFSVCHFTETQLNVKVLGNYGSSNATLRAFVPEASSQTSSCNGQWSGQPMADLPPLEGSGA